MLGLAMTVAVPAAGRNYGPLVRYRRSEARTRSRRDNRQGQPAASLTVVGSATGQNFVPPV